MNVFYRLIVFLGFKQALCGLLRSTDATIQKYEKRGNFPSKSKIVYLLENKLRLKTFW